jgi:hypothetical protein
MKTALNKEAREFFCKTTLFGFACFSVALAIGMCVVEASLVSSELSALV